MLIELLLEEARLIKFKFKFKKSHLTQVDNVKRRLNKKHEMPSSKHARKMFIVSYHRFIEDSLEPSSNEACKENTLFM